MTPFRDVRALLATAALLGGPRQHVNAQVADHSPLPPLTGQHSVGRAVFDWIDQSPSDSTTPRRHREVVVWAWYPATPARGADPTVWMPGKWGEVFWSEYSRARPGLGTRPDLNVIRSHAYADPPVELSSRKYPVLLFAPGSGTTPLDYSAIIEDVASHGYIVLGVESPDFGRVSVFADDRVVLGHDPVERPAPGGPPPSTALAIRAWENAAGTFGKDLSLALTQLTMLIDVPLKRAADLTRVGVFGHSLGGAAALQCAYDDPRVRAVLDIDGSPIWSARNGPLQKPVMILSAAGTNLNYDAVLDGATPGAHLRLAGTVHSFPSDVRVMPFAPQAAPNTQLIPPARALRVTAAFVEAFFNEYLMGQRESILHGPTPQFPEITFQRGASATGGGKEGRVAPAAIRERQTLGLSP